MKKLIFALALSLSVNMALAANKTVTVKGGGAGDYSSLSAAFAGESTLVGKLIDNACILTIECYASVSPDVAANTGTGFSTDNNYYINVTIPTSERHTGKLDTSKYYILAGVGINALVLRANDTYVDGIQLKSTGGGASANLQITSSGLRNIHITNSIMWGAAAPGWLAVVDVGGSCTANSKVYFNNDIVYGGGHGGQSTVFQFSANTTTYVENCSIVNDFTGNTTGFNNYGGTLIVKNSIVYGHTYSYSSISSGSDYNSTDTSEETGGPNSKRNQTFSFVNTTPGSEDYHLLDTDTGAKDSGIDLSSDAGWILGAVDIDGETRSDTWDAGADEYVAAAPPGPADNKRVILSTRLWY